MNSTDYLSCFKSVLERHTDIFEYKHWFKSVRKTEEFQAFMNESKSLIVKPLKKEMGFVPLNPTHVLIEWMVLRDFPKNSPLAAPALLQCLKAMAIVLEVHHIEFDKTWLNEFLTKEKEEKERQHALDPDKEKRTHFYFKIEDALKKLYKCEPKTNSEGLFIKTQWEKYKEAGFPRSVIKWVEENVMPLFICMTDKPKWTEKGFTIHWPFHNDEPMVFYGQFDSKIIANNGKLVPRRIFVFGYREMIPEYNGFTQHYYTFDQSINDGNESIESHYRKEERRMKKIMKEQAEKNEEAKKQE